MTQKLSLILLFFGVMLFSSCIKQESKKNEYNKIVKTHQVEKISPILNQQFPAVIEEAEEISIAFRVAGPISKIHVHEGQYVRKGDLIAEMDPRDYLVQIQAIESQVNQVKSEYNRIEELNKRKSVSDNDFEKMKAGKELAEAKFKNAKDQLNDTKLYAPFNGFVSKVMFENGELVNQGTPIVKLIDVSLLKVEVDVPVSLYINKENIKKIECTQDYIKDETYPLELYSNNIKGNANGLYKLYLYNKPNSNSKLTPGMNVTVDFYYTNQDTSLLSIPISAVFNRNDSSYIWLVNDNKVSSKHITTIGVIKDGKIVVTDGLKVDDTIVVGGLDLLNEDQKVSVKKSEKETNVGNLL